MVASLLKKQQVAQIKNQDFNSDLGEQDFNPDLVEIKKPLMNAELADYFSFINEPIDENDQIYQFCQE